MNFLKAQGVSFEGWYLDTLYLSRKLLKNVSCHKLEYLCDYFGIIDTHHRAASDCLMTNELMYRLAACRSIEICPACDGIGIAVQESDGTFW